jgi:RNA 2',3'-cyclic 3'-phosphodiesterase
MSEQLTRAFIALEIPIDTRREIGRLCESMRRSPEAEGLRFVRPEILHMTLRFFGDLDRKRLDRARRAIQSLDGAWDTPADLSLGEIGAFPSRRRPQTIWLGVSDPSGALKALADDADRAIRVTGFGPADKPFVAHLTIARLNRGRPAPDLDALTAGLTAPGGPLTISSITLFESVLRGGRGPEYTPLGTAKPRGAT